MRKPSYRLYKTQAGAERFAAIMRQRFPGRQFTVVSAPSPNFAYAIAVTVQGNARPVLVGR
jgi:hypothetical protein